jgi:hypothetical protein
MVSATSHAFADANFTSGGDFGCKSDAIKNINNIAGYSKNGVSFIGNGDIVYKCSTSSSGSLQLVWSKVTSKKSSLGNHECEESQGKTFFKNNFGLDCKSGAKAYIRGNSVGIIVMNQYTSYKKGSSQYNFVVSKIAEWKANSNIIRIFVYFHEPIDPVNCSGSHCHGLDKPAFKSTYNQIFLDNDIFVVAAHTHLTAFGSPDGKDSAVCGGGGEDGTSLNGNGKYNYVSKAMGICLFHVTSDKVIAQHIGTSGQVLKEHIYN